MQYGLWSYDEIRKSVLHAGLKTTQNDKEEIEEVTASVAAAKEISCSCSAVIRTGQYFHIKRRTRSAAKGFWSQSEVEKSLFKNCSSAPRAVTAVKHPLTGSKKCDWATLNVTDRRFTFLGHVYTALFSSNATILFLRFSVSSTWQHRAGAPASAKMLNNQL